SRVLCLQGPRRIIRADDSELKDLRNDRARLAMQKINRRELLAGLLATLLVGRARPQPRVQPHQRNCIECGAPFVHGPRAAKLAALDPCPEDDTCLRCLSDGMFADLSEDFSEFGSIDSVFPSTSSPRGQVAP